LGRAGLLAVYVSGHGYGHATRTAEVLRELRRRAPGLPITVSTSAPRFLFESEIEPPLVVRHVECDVGLAQRDALVIDEAGTVDAWRTFASRWEERVESEAAWLRGSAAHLVVGDIPPLAFAAAERAGLEAVAVANFSWDWIYRHLAAREPALAEAATQAAGAYGSAGLLLRLPFSGDLSAFRRVEDVPLVARRPTVGREATRLLLGLRSDRKTVLLSFGGVGLPGLSPAAFAGLGGYEIVLTGLAGEGPSPPNLRRVDGATLAAVGLSYPDLVGAADVVVTKPGYGIVSDCVGAGTRLVYTDRGHFPEYPIIVEQLPRYLPAAFVSNGDLREGRLGPALESALALPFPPSPRMDGAPVVAERLLRSL
jgi:hypothetical protein